MKINYSDYQNIILDFDGVILDSNSLKEKAIKKASSEYLDKKKTKEFVEYFISNNGIPREMKINKFFDEKLNSLVLNNYNNLLQISLEKASFTKDLDSFLNELSFYKLKPFILSGGDEKEIINLLIDRNYLNKFQNILGGPKTKYENLNSLKLKGKTLYLGDSKVDYEVAQKYNFDFIFMYGYTQFSEWKEFFDDKNIFMFIKNFSDLLILKEK